MKRLYKLIANNEDWLMHQVLSYAKKHGYVNYSSTLVEAWRISIAGLSKALLSRLKVSDEIPELTSDDDFTKDPIARFGILESQRHRARGIDFCMFLGLMKYYRQSYIDLIIKHSFNREYEEYCRLFIDRSFDRIELGFSSEWVNQSESNLFKELQISNREIVNVKNKYLTIFESNPNPVFILKDNNLIDNLNYAAAKLFEESPNPGSTYYDNGKEKKKFPWKINELLAFSDGNKLEYDFEKELETVVGIRCFQIKLMRMLDVSEKFIGIVVILNDITEHKKAEIALKKSEQKIIDILGRFADQFLALDNQGNIMYLNAEFENQMAIPRDKLLGENFWKKFPNAIGYEEFHRAMLEQKPVHIESKSVYNGKWLEIHVYPSSDGLSIIYHDITKRKIAEEKLRLSEERFSKIFQFNPCLIAIIDMQGRYIAANEAYCHILGYKSEEMIGKTGLELNIWIDLDERAYTLQMLKKGNSINNIEVELRTKLGEFRSVLISAEKINIEDEECFLVVTKDVTELKKLKTEISRLETLNLIGEMAAGMAHEIRNPMTTVRGFLQLLQNNKQYPNNQDYFNLMISELDRANSIITDFLSLAKHKILSLKVQNINRIIYSLLPLIKADGIISDKYVTLINNKIPEILLDEDEIRQLILNLTKNGLEAMQPGGNLTIKTFSDGENVVLAVKDEGQGIEPEVLKKIGTPFITTKEYGTGLGLARCYSIAQRHNATIHIETSPDGTTFFVRFPLLNDVSSHNNEAAQ